MSLLIIALAIAAALGPDPLDRARLGEVQCFNPDVLFKTCLSLEYYLPAGDGTYLDRGINVVALDEPFLIETSVPVQVRGKSVCGTLRAVHVRGGKVTSGGAQVPPAKAAAIKAKFLKTMASILDKEACMTFEPTVGNAYVAKVKVAGFGQSLEQPFIWVKPSDGYSVAP